MKRLIIAILLSVLIVSGLVWCSFTYNNKNTPQPTSISQLEPSDTSKSTVNTLRFVGFQKLTDYGLRESRLLALKNYLKEYAGLSDYVAQKVILDTNNIKYESENKISFTVSFDKNQHSAIAVYGDGGVLQLQLFDRENKLIYDSGALGNDLD